MTTLISLKKRIFIITAAAFSLFACQQKPFDPDIAELVSKMAIEEKIDFIGGYNEFSIRGYEHHGIPEIRISDGPMGVGNYGKGVAFPATIGMAATFNRELAYRYGEALGDEARRKNVHLLLGPGMNLYRMSINGRNFEYLGEDPFLIGQIAKNIINGIQDRGVMANAKHYIANNHERNRHFASSNMDEQTMHEIYLPHFKTVVQDARVASVMTAYNLINGIQSTEHSYLNNTVLREQWDYDGFVVTDWASTYSVMPVVMGGIDLEMPSGAFMNRENLIPLIESGELDEAIIDQKVYRILSMYKRFGLFRESDLTRGHVHDFETIRQTGINIAREGMVLLKNKNNALPLDKNAIARVGVIGPYGERLNMGGRGSSFVDPLHPLSFFDALQKVAPQVEFLAEEGIFTGLPFPEGIFDEFDFYIKENGQRITGANVEFFLGRHLEGDVIYSGFVERIDLEDETLWAPEPVPSTNFSARFTTYFMPTESGFYSIAGRGDDGYRIFVDGVETVSLWRDQGPTSAKQEIFLNGGQEYRIVLEMYQAGGGAMIQLGIKKAETDINPERDLESALRLASEVDWVIMPVGFSANTEGEAADRSFYLPYEQATFINQIAEVNPNVIVLVTAGGGFETESWLPNVKAMMAGWYPGQEGTLAAAEIIFGDINPSGKLPFSFEKNIEGTPWYHTYFTDDIYNVDYEEGLFVGYRFWDVSDIKPAFPFGFGLSYTTFEYTSAHILNPDIAIGESLEVTVSAKNTGSRAGAESVQLYVERPGVTHRPIKELKDFAKLQLDPGQERSYTFSVSSEAFSIYNPKTRKWEIEAGNYNIVLARSSQDIEFTLPVSLR